MQWRKTLFVLHRDVGFVALGLTIVYGISGIAVNHRRDWNYDRSVSVENLNLGRAADLVGNVPADRRDAITRDPTAWAPDEEQRIVRAIAAKVGRPEGPRNAFWRGPDRLSLFFGPGDDDTVDYTPSTGEAIHTTRKDRILLRQMNFLHLNEPGRWWTWVADLYAFVPSVPRNLRRRDGEGTRRPARKRRDSRRRWHRAADSWLARRTQVSGPRCPGAEAAVRASHGALPQRRSA